MPPWWEDPTNIGLIIAFVVPTVTLLVWCLNWILKHATCHVPLDEMPAYLNRIDTKVTTLMLIEIKRDPEIDDLQTRMRTDPDLYLRLKELAMPAGNPYDPSRRNELLDKYQNNSITLDEAYELQDYLNEDVAQTRGGGSDALLIIAAIAGLAGLIFLLTLNNDD